jgi:hypothetical protein
MIVRHRIPSVFGIYMVDVLCCALGCVILLWQVNYQEAQTQTAAAKARNDELTHSLAQLDLLTNDQKKLVADLAAANTRELSDKSSIEKLTTEQKKLIADLAAGNTRELADKTSIDKLTTEQKKLLEDFALARTKLKTVTVVLDDTKKSLDASEKLALVRLKDYESLKGTHELALAALEKFKVEKKDLETKTTRSAEELTAKLKANAELLTKIAQTEGKLQKLAKNLDKSQAALAASGKQLDEKTGKLVEIERLLKLLGSEKIELLAKLKTADLRVNILESETKDSQKRFDELTTLKASLDKKIAGFDKELLAAQASLSTAKADASAKVKALENRFAGITLTGRHVMFLVDMSGSMELIDENTAEPDKWPLVCDTVAKIMTSLPDLKFFQVILFSDKVRYPLGHDGGWFQYRGKDDAAIVANRLKAIKPKGETNMYDAFDEVFGKFRSQGLDTIYMLSDGLPNAGTGLPANAANLNESQVTSILSKVIRDKLKSTWNRKTGDQTRVRINTIGFFFESPDVGAFLWALSREHDGSFVGMSKP